VGGRRTARWQRTGELGAADPPDTTADRERGRNREREAREKGEGGEWRPEVAPTGHGGDLEALHHPGLGPNRVRLSDERRERGHDHGGHGSETPTKASQGDRRRQLFVAGEQVGSVRKHRGVESVSEQLGKIRVRIARVRSPGLFVR